MGSDTYPKTRRAARDLGFDWRGSYSGSASPPSADESSAVGETAKRDVRLVAAIAISNRFGPVRRGSIRPVRFALDRI